MTEIYLRIIDLILFTCFAYAGLRLIERIVGKTHYSAFVLILVGLAAAVIESVLVSVPLGIAYLVCFLTLYIMIYLLFRVSGINNIYGTLAILVCAMCLRGFFGSLAALFLGIPVFDIFNDTFFLLAVSAAANLSCFVIILFFSRQLPTERIRLALEPRAEKTFLFCWMIGCALMAELNTIIFAFYVDSRAFTILEGTYCLVLLCGCYTVLVFTFRANRDSNINSELLAKSRLQSALVRDALFVAQANVTANRIIDGLQVYSEKINTESITYDSWLEFARAKVHPDDYDLFYSSINRKNLLSCFEQGGEPDPFIYRRYCDDGEYRWVKVSIRLYSDITTNDVHIVGYALDVDADMREKEELEKRAKTDSLTKLLNRGAAEKAIAKEIENGHGALFLMDIDDFKDVNDCMGHETGDKVLIGAANRLKKFFGDDNIVGRLGGDEFLAYLKDINDEDALAEKASRLIDFLSQPPEAPDEPTISFSLGVAPVKEKGLSFTTVYSQADSALYEKKYNGKHGFLIYSK